MMVRCAFCVIERRILDQSTGLQVLPVQTPIYVRYGEVAVLVVQAESSRMRRGYRVGAMQRGAYPCVYIRLSRVYGSRQRHYHHTGTR